jgi:hypothetical protein
MLYTLFKLFASLALIVAIPELAKRASWLGGLLASLPIISLLAIVWLYLDTRDLEQVSSLSSAIFWLVLPSLSFFIMLPMLLRMKFNFWLSLGIALAVMIVCYLLMVALLKKIGIQA